VKCERAEDKNCYKVLEAAGIIGRAGSLYDADDRYMRLTLLRSKDDFDILVNNFKALVAKE